MSETEKNESPGSVEIVFPRPVKIGGVSYTAITMREPTVDDEIAVAAASKTGRDGENEARLIAMMCGLDFKDVVKLRSGVARLLRLRLMDFLLFPWGESAGTSSNTPCPMWT